MLIVRHGTYWDSNNECKERGKHETVRVHGVLVMKPMENIMNGIWPEKHPKVAPVSLVPEC